MRKANTKSEHVNLRQRAEDLFKKKKVTKDSQLSKVDTLKLIHELEVHQIELELMNEELIQANQRATAAADKYCELYDFAPSGHFTLSREGKIIELNLFGSQLLGKERSHYINKHFGLFISKETRPTFNIFLEKVFQSKTSEKCELELIHEGNPPVNIHLSGIISRDEAQCLLTATDITERIQAKKDLQESEEKYRLLAEHMTDIAWLMDMGFKVTYQSPSSEKLRGFTSEEIKELPMEKNLAPESLKLAMESFNREMPVIEANIEYSPLIILELEYYCKDGTTIWLESKFSLLRNGNGIPFSILGEGRDISARRQVEKALKSSESHARALLSAIPDMMFMLNREGVYVDYKAASEDLAYQT